MNEDVKQHIAKYNESKGWETSEASLFETIKEAKVIWKETKSLHRWYDLLLCVTEVNGMLIGYCDYYITGDSSPSDLGLEDRPESVVKVEKKQKTVDYYESI